MKLMSVVEEPTNVHDAKQRIQAAKRTIRAEVTLVIIIIVISSWSIYALYKFTTGSDHSFFGMTFTTRPNSRQQSTEQKIINDTTATLNLNTHQMMMMNPNHHQRASDYTTNSINPHQLNYSQQDEDQGLKQKSQQLLQQLIAGQRELYANLGPHSSQIGAPLHQLRPYSINSHHILNPKSDEDGNEFKVEPGYRQSTPFIPLDQRQLSRPEAHDRSSSSGPEDDDDELQTSRGMSRLNFPDFNTSKQPELPPPPPPPPMSAEIDHKSEEEDREAAESSRDTGESSVMVDGGQSNGGESDAGDHQTDESPSSSPTAGDNEGGESGSEEPSLEQEVSTPPPGDSMEEQDSSQTTTTPPPPPPSSSGSESTSSETDQSSTNGDGGESDSVNQSNDASDEPASTQTKETSQSIDDEVDRMTQPSSGSSVFHQQERPFDYSKNTVQFDDSIPSSSDSDSYIGGGSGIPARANKFVSPGDQVARFQEATQKGGMGKSLLVSGKMHDDGDTRNFDDDDDLQVDHNRLIVRNGQDNETGPSQAQTHKPGGGVTSVVGGDRKSRKKVITTRNEEKLASRGINHTKATEFHTYSPDMMTDLNNDKFTRSNHRHKRDTTTMTTEGFSRISPTKSIRAPYEIEEFLNKLDFDSLMGLSSSPPAAAAASNSLLVRKPRTLNKLSPGDESGGSSSSSPNVRRFGGGGDDNYDGGQLELPQGSLMLGDPNFMPIVYGLANGSHPMPSYVTSNNTDLQELLNKRRLLDALKYSQLPSPQYQAQPNRNNNQSSSETPIEDTKTAGTLYHVDHGMMLFPSADERHSHKSKEASMSKKKKKHKKSKEKKKTTVAFKKGGHKKKKHKKEEKKYLKEKKFKGAKKGKKVSKGKGGAGGKKGKKLFKDKGYKKKGFKKVYHKEEWGNKKSFFDEFRDKDFKKKWKKFDDKYNYAHMKKYQAKDEKGAKKMKHHDEVHKKFDKGKWKKSFHKKSKEHKESSKKEKKKKSKKT